MSVTAARLAGLSPGDRAAFATSARLLSCLVTESMLRALYLPIHGFEANGICIVLNNDVSSEPPSPQPYASKDIFALIPLYHVPVFKHDGTDSRAKEIGLLDPLDMMPLVFEVDPNGTGHNDTEVMSSDFPAFFLDQNHRFPQHTDLSVTILNALSGPEWEISKTTQLFTSRTPVSLWEKFGMNIGLEGTLLKEISAEFESSVKWQSQFRNLVNESRLLTLRLEYSYEHPPPGPQFTSPSIQWEQSIVEGHPTHPVRSAFVYILSLLLTSNRCTKRDIFCPPFRTILQEHMTYIIPV